MIKRSDILSIPYFKKSAFTGSCQGMRYRLEKAEVEENTVLRAYIWEGPYGFQISKEEERVKRDFPFSEEGICQAAEWLNECWQQEEERWRKAQSRW